MVLTLSNLKAARGSSRKKKTIGRGGKRGTYSGRGMKGQRARSGGKRGLKARGFKQTLRRIPKNRGFKSLRAKMAVVNVGDLDRLFSADVIIGKNSLLKAGLIEKTADGVKVLGQGKISKKLTVEAERFSASAEKMILQAGGQIKRLPRK